LPPILEVLPSCDQIQSHLTQSVPVANGCNIPADTGAGLVGVIRSPSNRDLTIPEHDSQEGGDLLPLDVRVELSEDIDHTR
jgi:hypothetical protein